MCSYNPTDGSGKSLCFAILPFALDDIYGHVGSIALIVSPYKVLMKDQVSLLAPTLMVKFTVGMACMQVSSHRREVCLQLMLLEKWMESSNPRKSILV